MSASSPPREPAPLPAPWVAVRSQLAPWRIAVCLTGLVAAIALRVVVAGPSGPASLRAGLVFAATLAVVAALGGVTRPAPPPRRTIGWGVAGGLVLCVPAVARHLGQPLASAAGFASWALVVVAVAVTEEALLRGALYAAVVERAGPVAAVAVGSVAFAALHVPLYGWGAVPLDLAVGVWLGVLRTLSGSVGAPALAHVLADLVGWWVR